MNPGNVHPRTKKELAAINGMINPLSVIHISHPVVVLHSCQHNGYSQCNGTSISSSRQLASQTPDLDGLPRYRNVGVKIDHATLDFATASLYFL
jgi:hypothetical protein